MRQRADKAVEYFKDGCNCAQAVLLAYADLMGLDSEKAAMLGSPLGGGMGRLREVCGAVSGMFLVLGGVHGDTGGGGNKQQRTQVYARVQQMAAEFEQEKGSIICGELLKMERGGPRPEERTPQYYKKRPCVEIVRCAAELADKHLVEMGAQVKCGELP